MGKNHVKPEEDPTSIGNILVSMGVLTIEQLDHLVAEFKASKEELLGEFIVRHTSVTKDHIELAIIKQRALRGNGHAAHATLDATIEISNKINGRLMSATDELIAATKGFAKY